MRDYKDALVPTSGLNNMMYPELSAIHFPTRQTNQIILSSRFPYGRLFYAAMRAIVTDQGMRDERREDESARNLKKETKNVKRDEMGIY